MTDEVEVMVGRGNDLKAGFQEVVAREVPNVRAAYEKFLCECASDGKRGIASRQSVWDFCEWVGSYEGARLTGVQPKMLRTYLDGLGEPVAMRRCRLVALRKFFDHCVTQQAMIANPALSVRGEGYFRKRGGAWNISKGDSRRLVRSLKEESMIGFRDASKIAATLEAAARIAASPPPSVDDASGAPGTTVVRLGGRDGKFCEIRLPCDPIAVLENLTEGQHERILGHATRLYRNSLDSGGRTSSGGFKRRRVERMLEGRWKKPRAGRSDRRRIHPLKAGSQKRGVGKIRTRDVFNAIQIDPVEWEGIAGTPSFLDHLRSQENEPGPWEDLESGSEGYERRRVPSEESGSSCHG